jgi:2-polyprenyl-6-methoxyphenol hydroxylase-like FAD-dependent oxidoreductase
MEKQRICIVGDGLSGLTTAIALNNLPNVDVELAFKKKIKIIDNRTTAISESNFRFLREIFTNLNSNLFWPSKKIKLFFETNKRKINFINFQEANKNLMYVYENYKLKNCLINEIKKKRIKIQKKKIESLDKLKNFDLIVLCLGRYSKLYRDITSDRIIKKDYKEIAITGHIKHNVKDLDASQFFLKEGPLAVLPFSKNKFSFVWSLDKSFYEQNFKNIKKLVNNKIIEVLKIKKNIEITNVQSFPISMELKKKYHKKNILILGEGLHTIHPIAGQGFNLVLRDIIQLQKILRYYLKLGLNIKNSYALEDFYNNRKSENVIFGLGVDLTHNFFKYNKILDPFKKVVLKNINRFPQFVKLTKQISNKGFI